MCDWMMSVSRTRELLPFAICTAAGNLFVVIIQSSVGAAPTLRGPASEKYRILVPISRVRMETIPSWLRPCVDCSAVYGFAVECASGLSARGILQRLPCPCRTDWHVCLQNSRIRALNSCLLPTRISGKHRYNRSGARNSLTRRPYHWLNQAS